MTVTGDLHQRLWENAPPCRAELPDGSPVWLVTRYADVRALLADPRLSVDKANGDGSRRGFSLPPALDADLLNMDPPHHTRIRRLVSQAFTPRRVENLRPAIQHTADILLDRIAAAGEEPRWRPSFRARGLASLPVRLG
jgi:cytochrome P450